MYIIVYSIKYSIVTREKENHILPSIATRGEKTEPHKCRIAGWGVTEDGYRNNLGSPVLFTAEVDITSNRYCAQAYGELIQSVKFCAGKRPNGEKFSADSCQGDSGGPLVCETENGFVQYGVVSYGAVCGNAKTPGVYAKVASAIDWIEQTIGTKQTDVVTPTDVTNEIVWGVTGIRGNDGIFYRKGLRGEWKRIDNGLRQVTVGPLGLIGVNAKGDMYHRTGTYDDPTSEGTGWQKLAKPIGSTIQYASWGNSAAWVVDLANNIYYTKTIQNNSGELSFAFEKIPGRLKHISSSAGIVI